MPELPEVETVIRGLKKTVLNQTIESATVRYPKINADNKRGWTRNLKNQTIVDIRRRGKNILIDFENYFTLWVHLKMTGHFYYYENNHKIGKHDLIIFKLKDNDHILIFNDYRRFGRVRLFKTDEIMNQKGLSNLGPEPLEITAEEFIGLFRSTKRMIKPALLDQTFLAGLGNIYADEALYASRIHPKKLTSKISKSKLTELHGHIQRLLKKAINLMGTSVDSFAGVNGQTGKFQKYLLAYGREDEPCSRCKSNIKREKIGSRSAHYCPSCQRL